MPSEHLKLRSGLVVSRQETAGEAIFVVKDPISARFFRLREPEFRLAEQLDGRTPLDLARRNVEQRFSATIPSDSLEQFVEKLLRLGLLDTGETATPVPRSGRVRGSLFYLRLRAFDPDRLLDRLVGKLGFFFTPHFLACSAGLILLATGISIASSGEIGRDMSRLYRFQALILAWLAVVTVTAAHEFAHGLACKRFGGKVHEIGFLLLYLQPALYCNVSDAWLFPRKSSRLWVTFAGAYFEMCLWAVATVVWRVTDPGGLHYVALVVMVSSLVRTCFNLNPLIKLDGYYLLSDYLEVPNLRQRALGYLGTRVRALWAATVERANDIAPRERRIYLTYGVLAATYSSALLGIVMSSVGSLLVSRYQAWGLFLFAAAVVGMFRKPLARGLAGLRAVPGRGRPMRTSARRAARYAVVLAALVAVLLFASMELRVSGEFRILPVENADVRAEVDGVIEQIPVDEGQVVEQGDVIARLSDRDARAELRKIAAEIDEKQARLRMAQAGPRPEEIDVAQAAVLRAEERLRYGRKHLTMLEMDPNLVSRKEFDEAREEVAVRAKELDEVRGRLRLLLAGSRPEEREALQAEVARLQAERAHVEEQLGLLTVVSPRGGVITTPRLKEKIGRHVSRGDLVASVHELRRVRAEIAISEKEIADVRVGQRVVLKARAYPEMRFDGEVTSVAPVATRPDEGEWGRTILVVTRLENPSLLLKPEMTGNAKISAGRRRPFDLITRRLARYLRVEFWSWW